MMPTRHVLSSRLLSPSLLALAALWGGGGSLWAATADERDQHFIAVQGLIDRGIRPSAERQKAAFAKAGYPEAAWQQKALDWFYAETFKTVVTDPKVAAALDKEGDLLKKDLMTADAAGKLPPAVSAFLSGIGDPSRRLVNTINQFLEPDALKPLVAPAPERVAQASRQIESLLEAADATWTKNVRRITANKAVETNIWDLNEKDPKFQKIAMEAVGARADALRGAYTAHLVLREVITRGATWGLDPAPVTAWYKKFLTANAKTIADWDYNWGDFQPDLKLYCNVMLLEALRLKVPDINQDEIEVEVMKIIDLDLKQYRDAVREGVLELQIKAWTALIKSRLELGKPEDLAKGQAHWDAFRERSRGLNNMKPACAVPSRAMYLGQLWITAGRLLEAKGDKSGAAALYGEVAGATKFQPQMLIQAATSRLRSGGPSTGGSNSWASPATAQDPTQAISVARVLMREASNTADTKLARSQLLQAATLLRAGILSLEDGDEALFIEVGPDLYNLYAAVFSRLEMRWHAAIAAEEGLAAVASRIQPKGANPWKRGDVWTEQGKKVTTLAKNTLALVGQLYSRAKGNGVQRLYDDAIDLVKRVAPELAGENLEWNQVVFRFEEGDFAGCIASAQAYAKKYPEQELKTFGLISVSRMNLIDELKKKKDEAGARKVAETMIAESEVISAKATKALQGKLDEAKAKEWRKAQTSAESSKVSLLMTDEKYAEVLAKLGPDYWKNPPADESLRARMLRTLVIATHRQEFARIKNEAAKNDAKALVAAWPQFDFAYDVWKRLTPGIKDPEERARTERTARSLGLLFQWAASAAETFRTKPGAPDGLTEIARKAKRQMADCLEPGLTEKDKPRTILAIAQTLWDIDEHERAVRLYEMFRQVTRDDAVAAAFRTNPKPTLDAVEAQVGDRPELRADWAKVRDLVEDKPGLADLIKQGVPKDQWGEAKADFSAALVSLREFKPKVDAIRSKLGDIHPKAIEAIQALDAGLLAQVEDLAVRSRLASGYRELGRKDQARALFQELYAYDPGNGTYASAIVDITLDEIKAGKVQGKEIDTALDIAKGIRNDAGKDRDLYWQASIQAFELSIAKGDTAYVNQNLRFLSVDQSDPSHDLVLPAVLGDSAQTGDDKRVRRARNALAVELARRYLALFNATGVTEKSAFKILELPSERPLTIFVPVDAPPFTLVTVPNADEVDTTIIVEQGKTGLAEKKADKPAETPAATPAK